MKNLPYIKKRKETEGLLWVMYRNFLVTSVFPLQKLLSAAQCSSKWEHLQFVIDCIYNPSRKAPKQP